MHATLASDKDIRHGGEGRLMPAAALRRVTLTFTFAAGCGAPRAPSIPPSQGHITAPAPKAEAAAAITADIPPPARVSTFVPPPKPTIKPQTYSVVVNEVPVKELLLALSRDTKQNIDVHPGISGLVSLNAINETLPAILERITKQINMRYRIEGNTIIVSPDAAFMKSYRSPYVNMTRDTTSTVNMSGEIAASGSTGSGGGGSTGAGGSGTQVRTVSNNDFWKVLAENIRSIVTATRNQSQTADERARRAELTKAAREERMQQAEVVARAGAGANNLFNTAFGAGANTAQQALENRDDIIVNAIGGTISVLATERQHQLIQQHVDSITQMSQRQVLIEATIAEVTLSDAYQGGIDWSRLATSGGLNITQILNAGVANAFAAGGVTIGYTNTNTNIGNISASIKLLSQFGNTRVLSSPKLMALNNQTALLKVVDNIVYFNIEATTTTAANVGTNTTFNTTAQTVPVGMVMTLTPQINENGQVTLTVRPTVTRINGFANDPNPSLCSTVIAASNAGKCLTNPVPQVQTREMESVLQLVSGQTAVLGGLMQDNQQYNRKDFEKFFHKN